MVASDEGTAQSRRSMLRPYKGKTERRLRVS
jgi:hypothetical protein